MRDYRIWFCYVFAMALLIVNGLLANWSVSQLESQDGDPTAIHEVTRLLMINLAAKNAEFQQRSYIVTGDQRFLDRYLQQKDLWRDPLREAQKSAVNMSQRKNLAELEKVLSARFEALQEITKIYQVKGLQEARDLIVEQNLTFDLVEKLAVRITEEEIRLLGAKNNLYQYKIIATRSTLWIATVVGLILVVSVFYFFQHDRRVIARAVSDLTKEQEQYRFITDALPQFICTLSVSGNITYINQKMIEFCGRATGNIDDVWISKVHPEDVHNFRSVWQNCFANGVPAQVECRFNGWWFLTNIFPHRENGFVTQWFVTATDVTTIKKDQEELRLAKEVAERVNEDKDKFLAVVSHELRTPLTPIAMALSYMLDNPTSMSADETLGMYSMMRKNLDLECRLIDDLLDVVRILRGTMHFQWGACDLHGIVLNALEICRSHLDAAEITVVVNLDAERCYVYGDITRLQQLFWNLLKNAAKFAVKGVLSIKSWNTENEIIVEFHDTGIGISAEQMPRIFNAFEQGEVTVVRRFGGLGLGLAIGRSVAHALGGDLVAESKGEGLGSSFMVRLPLIEQPLIPIIDHQVKKRTNGDGIRIFFVEDDIITTNVVAGLLTREGFEVERARTVQEAKEKFVPIYDLLLSDIGLPDGTGMDVVRHVKGVKKLPAIALTGYGMEDDIKRAREAGFDIHLTKPIDFAELIEAIRSVLDVSQAS